MKYFLLDHVGSLNRGCEAIVRGTMNIILKQDSGAYFKLISYAPETDAAFGIPLGSMEKRELTKSELMMAKAELKLNRGEAYALRKMYSPVIDQAQGYDVCLSIGGDTYCYGDNAPIREITAAVKKRGLKTVLWGASIGKEDLTAEKIASLKKFDAVFARESLTYDLLEKILPSDRLFLFADPAFCMEREDLPLPDGFDPSNTLGFNLSPLITSKNPDIIDACVKFLKNVIETTTLQIALIPHVTEKGNNDCDVLNEIKEKLGETGRVIMLPDNLNANQYKGYIARLRFFIGARTHATIAAYSNGVPTIVLGYSVKSRGISKDIFGEEKFVLDAMALSAPQTLMSEFVKLIEQEDEVRAALRNMIPIKIKSAMDAGKQLAAL